MGGCVLFLNCLVWWGSKQTKGVALCTAHSEMKGLVWIVKELVWLRFLIKCIGIFKISQPTIVFEDNQPCIQLVDGAGIHKRTKYFEVEFFWLRQLNNDVFKLEYCKTDEQHADGFTKALNKSKFEYHFAILIGLSFYQDKFPSIVETLHT